MWGLANISKVHYSALHGVNKLTMFTRLYNYNLCLQGCITIYKVLTSAPHLSIFLQLTQHDYTATLELLDHPPEVSHSALQWTLSSYVGTFQLVALQGSGYNG